MAGRGRIRAADIAWCVSADRIDEMIGEYLQLARRRRGPKGLCPVHDEKSRPSRSRPSRGLFHCLGCGEGGDASRFVQEVDHRCFVEAVERLADRIGFRLTYEGGGGRLRAGETGANPVPAAGGQQAGQRPVLRGAAAHPRGGASSAFLTARVRRGRPAATFGCGYAPAGWDALTKHLLGRVHADELNKAGWPRRAAAAPIDRFHRRLLWPIRDLGGEVVGFGARRIFDDDPSRPSTSTPPRPRLPQDARAVRAGPGQAGDRQAAPGRRRRGLHGRHGDAPRRRAHRRRLVRHGVRRRARRRDPPAADGGDEFDRGEVIYTFDGDARARRPRSRRSTATRVRRPDLRGRRAGRPGPLRPAAGARATPRCATWWPAASRCSSSRSGRSCASTTSTPPRAGSRPCSAPSRWSPGSSGRTARRVRPPARRLDQLGRHRRGRGRPAGARRPATPGSGPARRAPAPDPDDPRYRPARGAQGRAAGARDRRSGLRRSLPEQAFTHPAYAAVHRAVQAAVASARPRRARPGWRRWPGNASKDASLALVSELAVEPMRSVGEGDADLRQRGDGPAAGDGHGPAGRGAQGQAAADEPGRGARRVHEGRSASWSTLEQQARSLRERRDGRADAVSLVDRVQAAVRPSAGAGAGRRAGVAGPRRAGARVGCAVRDERLARWRPRAGLRVVPAARDGR